MSNKRTSEIMEQAFKIVKNPNTFTKGVYARDERGAAVSYYSKAAVCFCSIGALNKVISAQSWDTDHKTKALSFLNRAIKKKINNIYPTGIASIVSVNDHLPKERVEEVWQCAIELAKYEERALGN